MHYGILSHSVLAIFEKKRAEFFFSYIFFNFPQYDRAVISTNPYTKDYVPDQKDIEANSALLSPLLRLTPPDDTKVELPSIDISEYYTGQSICLHAYEIRRGVKMKGKIL